MKEFLLKWHVEVEIAIDERRIELPVNETWQERVASDIAATLLFVKRPVKKNNGNCDMLDDAVVIRSVIVRGEHEDEW